MGSDMTVALRRNPAWDWPSRIALVIAAAASLGGCMDIAGVAAPPAANVAAATPAGEDQWRTSAADWGKQYEQNPGDKATSINYARALRALTRYDEAAAVMQTAAVAAPTDFEVLGEYGKALADDGQLPQAKDVLTRAYSEDRPDWRIMSVQGAVEDELGNHDGARKFYAAALKIAPGEPFILNNLGLSYALTKQLPQAETTLRQAAAGANADARVRSNLALVLSLASKRAGADPGAGPDIVGEAAGLEPAAAAPPPQVKRASHAAKPRRPAPADALASQ